MPGYLLKEECVAVTGVADLYIHSLLDRQQFADPIGEAAALGISSAAWPLFGLVWPSGVHLAAHMGSRPMVVGERILEVGCGLGLASLVSHRRGARVTASDCHPLAEAFLQRNVKANDLADMTYRHGNWAEPASLPGYAERAPVEGRFEVIMGSDVLYERDEAGVLSGFIARHAAAAGEVLIVDPNRGNRPRFTHHMMALGYTLVQHSLIDLGALAGPYRGTLLHYSRSAQAYERTLN